MLQIGSRKVILIHDYKTTCEALIKNHEVFMNRSESFLGKAFNNKGIILLKGNAWKEQREFIHSTLKSLGMGKNIMAERVQEEIIRCLQVIEERRGDAIDLFVLINTIVVNIICGVMFGKLFSHTDKKFLEIHSTLGEFFLEVGKSAPLNFLPFLKHLPGYRFQYQKILSLAGKLCSIIKEMIDQNVRKVNINDEMFQDLIQAYMTEIEKRKAIGTTGTSFDEENMLMNSLGFLLAGTETTRTTIMFGLLYLVYFDDVQEKLFEEIKTTIGTDQLPQMTDKSRLKYLNAFILETIRYSKFGPFSPDRIADEDVMLQGYKVTKGATIVQVYESMSSDKDVWGDPETFRPERFLDEVKKQFIPFSVGKRNCIGENLAMMELFLFFSMILQTFQLLPEYDGRKPSLATTLGVTRKPQPFKVRAILRSSPLKSNDL